MTNHWPGLASSLKSKYKLGHRGTSLFRAERPTSRYDNLSTTAFTERLSLSIILL